MLEVRRYQRWDYPNNQTNPVVAEAVKAFDAWFGRRLPPPEMLDAFRYQCLKYAATSGGDYPNNQTFRLAERA
jgi:hypothetical protein